MQDVPIWVKFGISWDIWAFAALENEKVCCHRRTLANSRLPRLIRPLSVQKANANIVANIAKLWGSRSCTYQKLRFRKTTYQDKGDFDKFSGYFLWLFDLLF